MPENDATALTARSASRGGQLPLECPDEPNPPREVVLLPEDRVVLELSGLRETLTGPERKAVEGVTVELPRRRLSYE